MVINVGIRINIERGDIVEFETRKCIVAEKRFTPEIYLVNLSNGLIVGYFDNIEQLIKSGRATLLAKNSDVELIRKKEA